MAGQKNIEVDALGHEKRTVLVDQPHAGDDLYLTIDARLQKVAEDLLGQELEPLSHWTRRRGTSWRWPAGRPLIRTCCRAS